MTPEDFPFERLLPGFDQWPAESRARLWEALSPSLLQAGEALVDVDGAGERQDGYWFVLEGEMDLYAPPSPGTFEKRLFAPTVVGLLSVLDGEQRSATAIAVTPTRALHLSSSAHRHLVHDDPWYRDSLLRLTARQTRTAHATEARLARQLDDAFRFPGATMIPGPYVASPFRMDLLVLDEDPGLLARLLPPKVSLLPGLKGRWLLGLSDFGRLGSLHDDGQGRGFAYREACMFVPCLCPRGLPALFVPEVYPDAALPVLIGRELYGFPKRMGLLSHGPGSWSLHVERREHFTVRWKEEQARSPGDFGADLMEAFFPGQGAGGLGSLARWLTPLSLKVGDALGGVATRLLLRKRIASEAREGAWDVDELIALPMQATGLGSFACLTEPSMTWGDRRGMPRGHLRGAWSLTLGLSFHRGYPVQSYLDDGVSPRLRHRLEAWWRA